HRVQAQRMRPLQSLTLEAMLDLLSTTCGHIPDVRCPDRVNYSLHDTLMSGFAMMFFQHASLLEFQRKMQQRRGRCNLETLFGEIQTNWRVGRTSWQSHSSGCRAGYSS